MDYESRKAQCEATQRQIDSQRKALESIEAKIREAMPPEIRIALDELEHLRQNLRVQEADLQRLKDTLDWAENLTLVLTTPVAKA